jgi:hypothetical protein
MDWKRKLTSRKLWIAVAALVSGMILAFGGTEDKAQMISGLILQLASVIGYLLAEGLTDVAGIEASYVGKHEKKDLDDI